MAEPLSNSHDRFFKEIFSRQETARGFLQHYLPQELASLLDLSTLEIHKDSFIDPELQEHFSDLLYQVTLWQGTETYIYVLFEHKSYPERLIAFQLLRYMVRIWEQDLKQEQQLLPILPLVIYHGRSRWQIPLEFAALLEIPEALKPYVPNYQYCLYDLSRYSDEEIRGGVILRVTLLLLKYIFREELAERLGEILGLLRDLSERETGLQYLEVILRYIAGSTERVSEAELRRVINEIIEEGDTLMPTLVEQWLEQGRKEGLEQGRQESALVMLRRFLVHRFGSLPSPFDQALAELDLAALTELSEIAFEAGSLAEVEAALANLKPGNNHQVK